MYEYNADSVGGDLSFCACRDSPYGEAPSGGDATIRVCYNPYNC